MREDSIANDHNDKKIILPTITLNYNDDGTSNNKVENNRKNDTSFDSNPSDSYCTYRDSDNPVNKEIIAIN